MKRVWEKVKAWWRRLIAKIRSWVVSLLVMLLTVIGGVALAGSKAFIWTNPTTNVDGSAFDPATEQQETRIYCGVDPAAFVPEKPGSPQTLTPKAVTQGNVSTTTQDFLAGDYSCFATVFSVYGYESDPSNVATFTVTPSIAPSAITDFSVVQ